MQGEGQQQPLPGLRTRGFRRLVQGVPTDFHLTSYADRVLLVVTQLGSVGTVIEASVDSAAGGGAAAAAALAHPQGGGAESQGGPTYTTSVLLGRRDEPLLQLCARQIVQQAQRAGCAKPILVCLGLSKEASGSVAAVKEVVRHVAQCNVWGDDGGAGEGDAVVEAPGAEQGALAAGGRGGTGIHGGLVEGEEEGDGDEDGEVG